MLPLRQGFSEFSAWENVRYGSTTERTDEPPASAAAEARCHLGARADCTADGGCPASAAAEVHCHLGARADCTADGGCTASAAAEVRCHLGARADCTADGGCALLTLPLKPAVTWVRGRIARQTAAALLTLPLKPAVTWVRGPPARVVSCATRRYRLAHEYTFGVRVLNPPLSCGDGYRRHTNEGPIQTTVGTERCRCRTRFCT